MAAGGRRLPSLAVTLAYVQACGGDVAEWQRRWQLLAAELAAETAARRRAQDAGRAPYPGGVAFEAADAERFFGREALLDRLVGLLAERRLVILTGPSGVGKSSLVRAGLLARLDAAAGGGAGVGAGGDAGAGAASGRARVGGGVPVALLTPGERPMEAYALALARLGRRTGAAVRAGEALRGGEDVLRAGSGPTEAAPGPTAVDPVLVVDQGEELHTRCRDARERARFLDALVATATGGAAETPTGRPPRVPPRCRVVLVLRSDQSGPLLAGHPGLAEAARHAVLSVGRPAPDELRRAITEPALRAGCTVEGALLAVLISTAAQQPGALPLLSAALLETWRRRSGNALTLAGFQATGGFEGALARTAEALFNGLDAADRDRARAVFLRLAGELLPGGVTGRGAPPGGSPAAAGDEGARKPVGRAEFDDPGVPQVLERLVRARLVVVDRDTVELSHHALPQVWPRLRGWLAEGREMLGEHRRLAAAARGWAAADRDPGLLYRGVRLEQLRRRVAAGELAPIGVERAFLAASARAAADDRRRAQRQNLAVAGFAAAGGALLALAGGSRIRRAWRW
ncbi:hypothetical protein [Kitasatospora sp. NPDC097643]|uniref:nSTAND1 domain-containing NTPase n=1 Tax=Kitasatospora sp. NPDC097643 TaxID=3157230 RepID=UPI0033184A47